MKRTPHTRSTQTFRRARTQSLSLSLSFESGPVQINGFLPALLATCKPEQHEEEELKQEQVDEKEQELKQQSEQEEPRQLTEMCRWQPAQGRAGHAWTAWAAMATAAAAGAHLLLLTCSPPHLLLVHYVSNLTCAT